MFVLDEALHWYDQGITPIPLVYRTKRPVVKWGEWRNQLPPLHLVKQWFAGLYNIAIIISGDLVVLDFDETPQYHKWRIAHPKAATTYTVKSNRGYHVYLYVTAPTATAGMAGGEILAAGHQLTVPPSVHESGHMYRAVGARSIMRIGSLAEIDIVPIETQRVEVVSADNDDRAPRVWLPTGEDNGQWAGTPVKDIKRAVSINELFKRFGLVLPTDGGKSYLISCPFHEDSTPSMQIWPSDNHAKCHSPSCRAHKNMDVIDLAALWWNVSNYTAIRMLAKSI